MNIRVSYDEMLSSVNRMLSHVSAYETCYQSMYEDIRSINSVWVGEDHNAYLNSIESFEANFIKMKDLLTQISEFVRNACNQYNAAQDAIRQQAQSLGI